MDMRLARDPVDGVLPETVLDPARFLEHAKECYRQALASTDEDGTTLLIRAGAWFERLALELSDPELAKEVDVAEMVRRFRDPSQDSPAGDRTRCPDPDRRSHRRLPLRDGCFLQVDGAVVTTRSRDIARGGMAVEATADLAGLRPGQRVRVTVPGVCFERACVVAGLGSGSVRLQFV